MIFLSLLPYTWRCRRCRANGRTVDAEGAVGAAEHHIRRRHAAFGTYVIIHRSWGGLRSRRFDGTVAPDAPYPGWAVVA